MSEQPRRFCFANAALLLMAGAIAAFPQEVPSDLLRQGRQMDIAGNYAEARKLFTEVLDHANTPELKAQAQRSLAVSYAFEGDCKNAVKHEAPLYENYLAAKSYFDAGETADELARICIDAGDLDTASEWYAKGHAAGMNEPEEKQKDLWTFRWEHAQARIAARRGEQAEAQKHVAAAKAVLDKGAIPEQAQFFPYLKGYVAFYAGDYKAALEELKLANQNDPFIQCMMGQTYEKLGNKEKAIEYYRMALAATFHSPPAAYAVPFARKKLS